MSNQYSQNDEQRYIVAACLGPPGRFLDIGAWNAIDKSNTRALFERGWTGVLVEPSSGPFQGIQSAYRGVDGMAVINAAVVIEPGSVEMWLTDDCCSTTDWNIWKKWKNLVAFQPLKSVIAGVTLEDIFQQYGEFEFVSIDTEGSSVDLCLRLLVLGHRPRCICVEHDERVVELLGAANAAGYVCSYASGENLVLARQ